MFAQGKTLFRVANSVFSSTVSGIEETNTPSQTSVEDQDFLQCTQMPNKSPDILTTSCLSPSIETKKKKLDFEEVLDLSEMISCPNSQKSMAKYLCDPNFEEEEEYNERKIESYGSQLPLRPFEWNPVPTSNQKCVPIYTPSIIEEWRRDIYEFPDLYKLPNDKIWNTPYRSSIMRILLLIATELKLSYRAIFLAAKLFDYYISKNAIEESIASNIMVSSLSLASKIESSEHPTIEKYLEFCENHQIVITNADLKEKEMYIFESFNFQIKTTTIVHFLRLWLNATQCDIQTASVTMFLATVSLLSTELSITNPELVAVSCIFTAFETLNLSKDYPLLNLEFDHFGIDQIQKASEKLVKCINEVKENSSDPIYNIFSCSYNKVLKLDYKVVTKK